jgi:hypothetical protein
MRVEILKAESDVSAKFELFQRLNTGGAGLTEQEVRNSIAVSLNRPFFDWLTKCSTNSNFIQTTMQTATALESQAGMELVLRFFSFRAVPYQPGLDVHEYLDDALMKMATNGKYDMGAEEQVFAKTFQFLEEALGESAFKRWNGSAFTGKFLMSVFEVMATGVSFNIAALEALPVPQRTSYIQQSARDLWSNAVFNQNSGGGVRGTTRLSRLLPIAAGLLKP